MKKKRLLSLAMAVAMIFGSAAALPKSIFAESTGMTASAEVENYGLIIHDKQVTTENCNDILGDGIFKYEPTTNTLTINGDYNSSFCTIKSEIEGLTINTIADSSITGDISLKQNATITGKGKLTVVSIVFLCNNASIVDANIKTSTSLSGGSKCTLKIKNSYVYVVDGEVYNFKDIKLEDCAIETPYMAQIRNGRIESRQSSTYDAFVRITPGEEYPIYVRNGNVSKTVTSNNCDDVFGDDTVKYSNENKILTFNGNGSLSSNNDFLLTSEVNKLTVDIDKDTTITQMDLYGITTIKGKGKLTARAIYFYGGYSDYETISYDKVNKIDNFNASISYLALASYHVSLLIDNSTIKCGNVRGISNYNFFMKNCVFDDQRHLGITTWRLKPKFFESIGWDDKKNLSTISSVEDGRIIDISPGVPYGITHHGGLMVTNKNCHDILDDQSCSYYPDTKTLTLKKDVENIWLEVEKDVFDSFTLRIAKDVKLTSKYAGLLILSSGTTITGPGKLTMETPTSGYGIMIEINDNNMLDTIIDGAYISGKGVVGIEGNDKSSLKIKESTLSLDCTDYAISGFKEIILDGCEIVQPAGAVNKNGTIYEKDGKTKAKKVIIRPINRLSGAGRYATAVEISKAGFPDGSDTVVLAYGLNYADALAGVSLATKLNAPILLTNTKTLDATTLAEIKRLKAKNVIILGGTGAVGAEVETALKKEGLKTERIAGKTRFETATKIAEKMQLINEKAPEDVFFVYAFNSADALSVSAVAAVKGAPVIYLKTTGDLDDATAAYLRSIKGSVKNAYVIGGEGVISNDMMKKAGSALGVTPIRVFGANRFETCVAVNERFADVLDGDMLCVATGMDFPDALAGGVFAALNKAPLFLVNGKSKTLTLSESQKYYLKSKSPQKIYTFGGTGAVPDNHVKVVSGASV